MMVLANESSKETRFRRVLRKLLSETLSAKNERISAEDADFEVLVLISFY